MSRTRTWTETIVFRHPFFLKAIGRELPPGSYDVMFEEREYVLHGHSKWQIVGCWVPLPASMLPSAQLSASANVDPDELRHGQSEDAAAPISN